MKFATTTTVLVALIAGSALVSAPQSRRDFRHLPQLVAATARLVALAVVSGNEASLRAAAQDFVAAQMNDATGLSQSQRFRGANPGFTRIV
jgi:NAD/NADP transhydrogenase beta subunit